MPFQQQRVDPVSLESGEQPESGPEYGSDAAITGGSLGESEVQSAQILLKKLDGEQGRPCRADDRGMSCADEIENRSKRTKFIEFGLIAFQILAVQHDRYVSQFVLMARHRTRNRLAEFRKHDLCGMQTSPNRRIEFASSQDFAGLGGVGHEVQTIAAKNGQPGVGLRPCLICSRQWTVIPIKLAGNVRRPG